MSVKLLTDHHLEFLSLKGDCTGSSKSTLVKMPHCWKSHVTAQICLDISFQISNNIGADQTTRRWRLTCSFVVHIHREY